jgi:hypothetical protein
MSSALPVETSKMPGGFHQWLAARDAAMRSLRIAPGSKKTPEPIGPGKRDFLLRAANSPQMVLQ